VIRWLLENDLVDEMNLLVVPVVVGQGMRLLPDSGRDLAFDLVESRVSPKGITHGSTARPAPAVCNWRSSCATLMLRKPPAG
jgi:dihydrofolate reductase